VAFGPI
jgi:hypothetical protein